MSNVTNSEFLSAIFGPHLDDQRRVWITSFWPDPATAPASCWKGRAWKPGDEINGEAVNTFFSIALLKPTSPPGAVLSELARKKTNFACLPCIMLDDIGTKVDEMPVEPSWLIETSPGNHQAGYILKAPIDHVGDADAFLKALVTAGRLTDAGGQNVTRYARLPVGSNTKAKYREPFPHRLALWEPDRRYDWRELADLLGLDLTVHLPVRRRKGQRSAATNSDDGHAFSPRADENPVVAELKARGLYKRPAGSGKHEITCPWVSAHSDQVDSGTAYFEPDDAYPLGGFKCLHGHCEHRHVSALLEFLAVSPSAARHKPTFRVAGGTLHLQVAGAERVLAESGRFFQQGGAIVTVSTPPGGETSARHIRKEALPFILTREACWLRYDARADEWVSIDAPPKVAAGLFESPDYQLLPPLSAIARQPYLRPDGSIVSTAGYDAMTGTFGAFDPREFSVPARPGADDVARALDTLLGLIEETTFATDADRSAALALFLTAAIRPALEVAPGFLLNAHAPGSGKSYLQDMAALLATDGDVASATLKSSDDEMEKSILAALLRSPAVLRFDESQTDIVPIKFLVSALTSEHVQGRILGQSKVIAPSTRTLVLFAGNNIQPVRDMVRRVVVCNLDAADERPESRAFRRDPLREVRGNRSAFVSAALTLVRSKLLTDPPRVACRPLNGFPRWDSWVRQTVLWLGQPDPCESMFSSAQTDPTLERLAALLEAWGECFAGEPRAARDAIKRADTHAGLHAVLTEIAGKNGEIDATRLGHFLKASEGRVISGRRLMRDRDTKSPYARYKLLTLFQIGQKKPSNPSNPSDEAEPKTRATRLPRAAEGQSQNLSPGTTIESRRGLV